MIDLVHNENSFVVDSDKPNLLVPFPQKRVSPSNQSEQDPSKAPQEDVSRDGGALGSPDITLCLQAIESGDLRASEQLLPLVYDELRQHAGVRMTRESSAHTLQATALVHEAWLRVVGKGGIRWESRAHFFGAAAEAMRRILIESARRKARLKRGGDMVRVDLAKVDVATASPEEKVLMIDEALEKLEEKDPQQARVVVLKFFMSHTNAEVADMLGISERTVERRWAFAKAWLFDAIKHQQNQ